jgi:hypothetical protein
MSAILCRYLHGGEGRVFGAGCRSPGARHALGARKIDLTPDPEVSGLPPLLK